MTQEKFKTNFESARVPVVFTDIVWGWPAWGRWTPDNLAQRFPEQVFKCAQASQKNHRVKMTMPQYVKCVLCASFFNPKISYMRQQHDEKPFYIFDNSFAERIPELVQEYKIPKFMQKDLFSLLGSRRPDYRWLLVGEF